MTQLTIVQEFKTPGRGPSGLAWDGTHLWNADFSRARIFRLDVRQAEASGILAPDDELLCPGTLSGLAWDGQGLWQALHNDGVVRRLNPTTHDIDMDYAIGHGWLAGLAWDGRLLWAVAQQQGQLLGIDPQSGNVQRTLSAPVAGGGLDFHAGHLWLGFPDRMTYDSDSESFNWANDPPAFALAQIDPATGQEVARYGLDFLPMGVAWVGADIWLSHARHGKLLRARLP